MQSSKSGPAHYESHPISSAQSGVGIIGNQSGGSCSFYIFLQMLEHFVEMALAKQRFNNQITPDEMSSAGEGLLQCLA